MADYVRLRLAAARVAVTMAFLALLAGIAERAGQSAAPTVNAVPAASYLKLNGLSSLVAQNFSKIENKLVKLDTTLLKYERTVTKLQKADRAFLKVNSANAQFLKIDDANAQFLKISDANDKWLKISDANAEFLKLDGTAANSSELGGLPAGSFFQGSGHVVTGALPAVPSQGTQQLLSLPDGTISVLIGLLRGQATQVTVHNSTQATLSAVQDIAGTDTAIMLAPGDNQLSFSVPTGSAGQLHLQIFPSGQAFPEVVTIMVSLDTVNGSQAAIGQAFTGGI